MIEQTVSIEGPYLAIREQEPGKLPHRRLLAPGRMVGAAWRATPLSAERKAVRDAAEEAWTPEVVAAFRAEAERQAQEEAVPAEPAPQPVSAEQLTAVLATLLDVPAERVQAVLTQAEAAQPEQA